MARPLVEIAKAMSQHHAALAGLWAEFALANKQSGKRTVKPPQVEARHRNGKSVDCRPSNILIGTKSQNELDKTSEVRRGSALKAATARRVLTPDQARDIATSTELGKVLAARYGVRPSTVSEIRSGKIYSEATGIEQRPRTRREVPTHLIARDSIALPGESANDTLPEAAGGAQ